MSNYNQSLMKPIQTDSKEPAQYKAFTTPIMMRSKQNLAADLIEVSNKFRGQKERSLTIQ